MICNPATSETANSIMEIDNVTFTVLDVETTGLYPHWGDRICEIGALKVSPKGERKTFEMLVDPEKPVSPGAYAVNRISSDMLNGKPRIAEIIDEFMDFIRDTVIVAYNARFDMGFIDSALGENRNQLTGYYIVDALQLARNLFPSIGKYNLSSVARYLDIRIRDEHRAMADVETTWEVFRKELELLKEKGIKKVRDISSVYIANATGKESSDSDMELLLQNAIVDSTPLKIRYRSIWDNKVSVRTITPKALKESYLVAYCHLRQARRNFRLDCILHVEEDPLTIR
ncbi:MAG: WYL domain-containing protein [Candidatus Omnitrophica bacterium]|nr:WYL domain-containing protein [Candidatus Omnitrophota bacterium]